MKKNLTPFWMRFFATCFTMIITITLVISTMFLCIYLNNNKRYHDNSVKNIMQYSQRVLENYFERCSNVVGNMSFAEQIYELQNSESVPSYGRSQRYNRILSNIYPAMRDISFICLYTDDGCVTRMGETVSEVKDDKALYERCTQCSKYKNSKEMWIYDNGYIVMCRDIIYLDSQFISTNLGYVLIYVDADKVNNACFAGFNNESYGIMYTDPEGNIALSSDNTMIGKKKDVLNEEDTRDYIECTKPMLWKCYSYSNSLMEFSGVPKIIIIIFVIDLICIMIIYELLNILIRKMSNPMEQLMDVARSIRKEQNGNGGNEIEYISKTIEELKENLRVEIEKNYQMNEQVKIAAMKAYESQVNPHFLNNTLQMIEMMSVVGDNKKIPVVTRSLGNMFRFSLDIQNEVKIADEIKNSEDYFKILKLRFGDNFEYKIIIREKLKEYVCPKFLIQPFVENAVTHAFENKNDKWEVVVTALAVWDNIVVIIKDNGNGIEKEKLKAIKESLKNKEYTSQKHIGIKNVSERIRLLYGDDYGVEIVSDKCGTQVMINIPMKKGDYDAKTDDC